MEHYANLLLTGGVFLWMLKIERHVAEIKTTCKLKEMCNGKGIDQGV